VTTGVPPVAPVPVRPTSCGLPEALSAMFTDAVRVPLAEGVKVTLMVQLAFAATVDPQLFDCAKSAGFVPVSVMLVILSAVPPLLVSVTVCGALVVPIFWVATSDLKGRA